MDTLTPTRDVTYPYVTDRHDPHFWDWKVPQWQRLKGKQRKAHIE